MQNGLINTGEPRNIMGHIVSGAVASAVVSGTINYKKAKEKKLSSNEAIQDTVKKTAQGAIATGTAIATANHIGQQGGFLKALTAFSVGMAGIYAVEVIDDKLNNKYEQLENSSCDENFLEEGINE
ncbi:hypothetical protein AMRN_2208 [Malaciobacter marinus]|uniref:Uncharacterized protein n=1 Tax=Malaciobacter marinus TaxID=505249 RepID=A0A347TMU2_9BACT|nr:hypothetical protein [Malaciobacter marinus]AXX87920.1 hypothetical protein AMRN_2208 [Malaciobacter marinus]PHO14129.1 hypothetical protein CPH92_13490 [Malaciobacter marinus]